MSVPSSPTLSDSELLDSLEADFDLGSERERRMAELRDQAQKVQSLRETEYGRVVTYGDEKKLIERMSKEKWCLIHFFHPDFPRCRIMDQRLEEIAPKFPHTLFLRASVADIPFLVGKFGIQVLPCVHAFVDGACVDRLIGFEELGQTDSFTSKTLEFRLKTAGVLHSGPVMLAHLLPTHLQKDAAGSSGESDEEDDRRHRDKATRKGKTGIRNGLASSKLDDEEWD